MSFYFYKRPMERSLFDDFEDDFFFNYPLTRKHHYGFGHRGHDDGHFNTLEKSLSKALKDQGQGLLEIADFSPKINLSEDEKNYYIHADLPGMTKDQVKMELNDDRILTISGERKCVYDSDDKKESEATDPEAKDNKMATEEEEVHKNNTEEKQDSTPKVNTKATKENERTYSLVECSYGKFSRSFSIPEDVDLDAIQAKMENGVLEVIFQKMEPPKHQHRSIQIQ